jgi:hypothetical protein
MDTTFMLSSPRWQARDKRKNAQTDQAVPRLLDNPGCIRHIAGIDIDITENSIQSCLVEYTRIVIDSD